VGGGGGGGGGGGAHRALVITQSVPVDQVRNHQKESYGSKALVCSLDNLTIMLLRCPPPIILKDL
jgi:hypothetical protein